MLSEFCSFAMVRGRRRGRPHVVCVALTAVLLTCAPLPPSTYAEQASAANDAAAATVPSDGARNERVKKVPDVSGRRLSVARQLLRLSDFQMAEGVFYIGANSWRDSIRPGAVGFQAPRADELAKADDWVAVWCFRPAMPNQETVIVPDVHDLNAPEALARLQASQLFVTRYGADQELTGKVVSQYPRAGQEVYEGTHVFLRLR